MKGSDRIIATLNDLLADELTATNQYMVHSEMCANWDYQQLHESIEKRAIVEMRHAEKLIARILFLEGQPIVSRLREIRIGQDVPGQFRNDLGLEMDAHRKYNQAVALAEEVRDSGTKDLLESILKEEEAHIDNIEAQLDQIKQMEVQNYLAMQIQEHKA